MTSSRMFGRDWSFWKYIDYDGFRKDPASAFAILRLSFGTYKDPKYDQHYEGIADLNPGAYHFFNPKEPIKNQLRAALNFRRGVGPLAFDLEQRGNLSRQAVTDATAYFLKEGSNILGEKLLLYANYDYLYNVLLVDKIREVILSHSHIWLAWPWESAQKYGLKHMQSVSMPKIRGYPDPLIWQFDWWDSPIWAASKVNHLGEPYNWGGTRIDLNRWEGTIEQFNEVFKKSGVVEEPTHLEKLDRLWDHHPELHVKGVV